jgi:glycosyltransferase involved in cell wall biosynthesis
MKRSKLNLLFVTPVSINYPGGAERWLYEVSTRLMKRGHDVGILYTDWTPGKISVNNSDFSFKDVKLYRCSFIKPPFRGMALVNIFSSRKIVNEYDLSYILAYPPNELQVRFFRKFIRKGLVAGIHSFLNLESDFIHRMYLPLYLFGMRSFDAIHVLNKHMLDFFRKSGFENVFLIPNGVDTGEYELCYPPWDSETFTVLFSGRLTRDKGADILIDIIRRTKISLNQEVKFVIAGTGPLKKSIEKITEEFRNVEYLGYVDRDVLKQVYRRAHLLLVPSRSEGMPLCVLEAQSCGLPVVGSRIPGIIDIVEDGSSGRLVTVNDVRGFVMALKEYYMLWKEFPEKYYEMNKKIREKTIKQYDWEQVMDKIEKLFIKISKISLGY